jgi:phage terminase large subunit GpA-like protein
MCYVAPVLYHLFEIGETVIVGLPSMDMGNDKWQQDFLPVIEASEYRDLIPLRGEGSRGGQVKRSVTFRNGATLRFMTAGGSDKQRAGYTSRVVAVTETDGMDESSETSREADKIEQIEGRTRAFGRTGKRIYLECTVSIERGRIWQEIKGGTDSRIVRPCPHCKAYVTPEREHLGGWETAGSEEAAAAGAFWSCPACGESWTEAERISASEKCILLHAGQEISNRGKITGDAPATQTLGFRWSAIDNPFVTAADLGAEEWRAKRNIDRENAEKKMRQFVWALPFIPEEIDLTPLDPEKVAQRLTGNTCGQVPDGASAVVVGVDTGKHRLHWVAVAVLENGRCAVIEYGEQKTEADQLGMFAGLMDAQRRLREHFERGWINANGSPFVPSQVWIDSGYYAHTDAIYSYCTDAATGCIKGKQVYRPTKGYSRFQKYGHKGIYKAPKAKSDAVVHIGTQFHIAKVERNGRFVPGVLLVHMNADHWKGEVHQRLTIPTDQPGAISLYASPDQFSHGEFVAQITAEHQVIKKGEIVWEKRPGADNHYLDATYSAICAAEAVRAMAAIKTGPAPTAAELARMAGTR